MNRVPLFSFFCCIHPLLVPPSAAANLIQDLKTNPTVTRMRKKSSSHNAQLWSCLISSSPVTLSFLQKPFWGTVSMTCANMMACSRLCAITLRLTPRPVIALESRSAGGTAHSAVSEREKGRKGEEMCWECYAELDDSWEKWSLNMSENHCNLSSMHHTSFLLCVFISSSPMPTKQSLFWLHSTMSSYLCRPLPHILPITTQ